MRFLLIAPQGPGVVKLWASQCTSPAGSMLPPVDLASIAAVLRGLGHEARILDLRLQKDSGGRLAREFSDYVPDAIVMNVTTVSAEADFRFLSDVPRGIKRICFGPHASVRPHEAFAGGADVILLGDPEASLPNYLACGGESCPAKGYILSPAEVVAAVPAYVMDLDALPFPALDLLESSRYRTPYFKGEFTVLLGIRGCPFSCSFCTYPVYFGRPRMRSVRSLVDEMEDDATRHGIRNFSFLDGTFNFSRERVMEFCDEVLRRNLRVSWVCMMRAVPVDLQMLARMRAAGCIEACFGVEDPSMLKEVGKSVDWGQIKEAFRLSKAAGLPTLAFLMLFPKEGVGEREYEDSMISILDELRPDAFQLTMAIPFPGTPMFEKMEAEGRLSKRWGDYDPSGDRPPYASGVDIVRVKANVYFRYPLRHPVFAARAAMALGPSNLWSMVRALGTTFLTAHSRKRDG